jgi:hypothetical protein
MFVVRRRSQFLMTYSIFLRFLLFLIIYGESTGGSQATLLLRQFLEFLEFLVDYDYVMSRALDKESILQKNRI